MTDGADSEYVKMLRKDATVWHKILAMFSTWILLAGFLVLPGSFETLEKLPINSETFKKVLSTMQNLPLLVVGFTCCTIGGIGMCYLWWRERRNYIFLAGSIFVPGWFSGIAGLISTFVSIYTHKNGGYGASSIASIAVTGASTVICGLLAGIYSFKLWLLRRIDHELGGKPNDTGSQAATDSGTGKQSV